MKLSNSVKIFKIRKSSKLPVRAHSSDAGMDIFYCPKEKVSMTIPEKQCVLLPTGVKIEVPSGYMLQIMNKSGIASKKQLITGACVVDEGYTGEIFVNPTCRWTLIGGCFRFFGGYAIGFYMQLYFLGVYPQHETMYGILNSAVVSACGFTSAIVGGYISDSVEAGGNYRAKANICIMAAVLGIPTMAVCTLY